MPKSRKISSDPRDGVDVDDAPTEDTRPSNRRRVVDNEDLSGHITHGYTFIRKLGSGGNCSVYEALRNHERTLVALKVLHRHIALCEVTARRFAQEIEAVKLIRHPNVITILDAGCLPDGRAYYAMEWFDGVSLSQMVRRRGCLAAGEALDILVRVCAGLAAAHELGVVHRDIKPANVLVGQGGDGRAVKIIDFGIAKLMRPDTDRAGLTADHVRVGSPVAMAPEQILGEKVDARTDVYAVGILGYYLLTGRYPFRSEGGVPIERYHLCTPAPHAAALAPVPMALDEALVRCMAKQPEQRFQSVTELAHELARCSPSAPIPVAGARQQPAVGVHVEVLLADSASEDDGDDELFRDIDDLLDAAAIALTAAGMAIQITTGNSLLATRLASRDHAAKVRQEVIESARALHHSLVHRPGAHPGVGLFVCVGSDLAVVEERNGQPVIIDCAIVRGAWLPVARSPGFAVVEDDDSDPDARTTIMQG